MDHAKRLDFIHKMTKLGLDQVKAPEPVQHLDSGGSVQTQGGGLLTPISDALGLSDKFQAGSADIQAGTNQKQLNDAYKRTEGNLNEIGAAALPLLGQVNPAVQQQQQLAQEYSQQAQGLGPNVAKNQLNEATAANVANQAALMASQRGASANTGLLARQAAQQGAATQQEAAGQAATLGAQQQIAAQNNLANLSNSQINQGIGATTSSNQAAQGQENILQGANTAANNAAVNMQSNVNNNNAMTAAANQNSNNGLFGSIMKGASSVAGFFGAEGGEVELNAQEQPTALPKPKEDSSGPDLASIAQLAMLAAAGGGQISGNHLVQPGAAPTAQSFVGQWLSRPAGEVSLHDAGSANMPQSMKRDESWMEGKPKEPEAKGSAGYLPGAGLTTADSVTPGTYQTTANEMPMASQGGEIASSKKKVPAMLSPGERYLSPKKVKAVEKGADPIKEGKKIPGKPKVKGAVNSYANDTVPAKLEEGGIVIPRNITQGKNPEREAIKFVRATLAKKGLRK